MPPMQDAQTLLHPCVIAVKFRADKSRITVIVKGRSMNKTPFLASPFSDPSNFSSFIPSIHNQPVKFLEGIIDGSLKDRKPVEELEAKLLSAYKITDGSYFSGAQKLWIMQHILIPSIQWSFLIYERAMSLAARLEQKVSTFICKRIHAHQIAGWYMGG